MGGKFFGCAGDHVESALLEPLHLVRRCQCLLQPLVQQHDDRPRSAAWREQTLPCRELVARQRLADGGHLRHRWDAFRTGDAQSSQPPGFHEFRRLREIRESDGDFTAHSRDQRGTTALEVYRDDVNVAEQIEKLAGDMWIGGGARCSVVQLACPRFRQRD